MYNPNGINQPGSYPHSNKIQPSYGISSSQSTGNICGSEYPPSSSLISLNDIQSSSSSWNQYAAAANLASGVNQINDDLDMYYASYYPNLFAQQYYSQQQQPVNQSQAQIPIEQTISPNDFPTSSNGDDGLDKNYQHFSR